MKPDTIYAKYPKWDWVKWRQHRRGLFGSRALCADVIIAVFGDTGVIKLLKNRFGDGTGTIRVLPTETLAAKSVPRFWDPRTEPTTPLERAAIIVKQHMEPTNVD